MFDKADSFVTPDGRTIGAVMMEMKNITLRFGGVVAIKDISFDAVSYTHLTLPTKA